MSVLVQPGWARDIITRKKWLSTEFSTGQPTFLTLGSHHPQLHFQLLNLGLGISAALLFVLLHGLLETLYVPHVCVLVRLEQVHRGDRTKGLRE
jgi:hypothetical protein